MAVRLLLAIVAAGSVAQGASGALAREVEGALAECAALRGDGLFAYVAEAEEDEGWTFDLGGYWTAPPDDDPYMMAVLRADHGALHLEGRYQYEDLDTGSIWAGWTFSWSGAVEFSVVPMLGGVFGHTQGVAPGLELDLVWRIVELYVEAEYVFDAAGQDDSFFYLWSELTVSPVEWLSLGLVAQRTRVYDTDVEVDRGLLVGCHIESFSATLYVFNLDQDDPYVMIGIGISF
jgi:hypothetical protein